MVNKALKRFLCAALSALLFLAPLPVRGEDAPLRPVVHPPRIPADGRAYDEWQGIAYTSETAFDVSSVWYLKEGGNAERMLEKHYSQDPERPFGRYEIVAVQAEPVGGEMRLRSGGYVDITVHLLFNITYRYSFDRGVEDTTGDGEEDDTLSEFYRGLAEALDDCVTGIRFGSPSLMPFDMYTGTALLNFIKNGDADAVNVMEATDSGFVESRVFWNGKIWRIFARTPEGFSAFPSLSLWA